MNALVHHLTAEVKSGFLRIWPCLSSLLTLVNQGCHQEAAYQLIPLADDKKDMVSGGLILDTPLAQNYDFEEPWEGGRGLEADT